MTMNCKDAMKLIHEVLDGTASEESRARLGEHLNACPDCAREHQHFARWETVLREPDPEGPSDAAFETMARAISAEVRKRERKPASVFAPSWAFSTALAAACLLIGLGVGHVAMPRTLTERVVQRVEVPGPERIVEHENTVVKEVPVEVVRTRTVVKRVPTPAPRPVPTLVAETPTTVPAAPPVTLAAAYTTGQPTVGTGIGARPMRHGYGVSFASDSASSVTSSDLRLLASRLRSDMSTVDEALGTSALAATLVADMGRAGADMDRALRAEPAAGTHDR